ncbi:hypothetical protein K6119_08170 [Paracrocinitomix mangrovi]|uniref:hypothetical protein n=1 Tax=Paracrocinitomix mangrovi TaxID=2862509 RepID=UPI001C8DEBA0|nr:hypothetical protein [Paracrocinitomix mangrovi]UKN03488.1 hypothetical protein K6119_08170 [Paracrocinitomix mangrovi]
MKYAYTLILTALFVCLSPNKLFCQSTPNLDGKDYLVEVERVKGKKMGSNWPDDTLKFDSGNLYSIYMMEREGFGSSSYSPKLYKTDSIQIILFKYKEYNKYGSLLQIKGKAQGNNIEGTISWTSLAGTREYTFSGVKI